MSKLAEIEDAMIAVVRAAIPEIPASNITTRNISLNPEILQKEMGKAPFIYFEYLNDPEIKRSEDGAILSRRRLFNVFIAAKNLRSAQEGQRDCYELLEAAESALDNVVLKDDGVSIGRLQLVKPELLFEMPGGTVYQQIYELK